MSRVDWDVPVSRLMTTLLGICVAIVAVGFVMPSPKEPAKAAPGYHAMAAPAAPVRLVVPALRIRAPILPIEVNAQQVLDPPRNPRDVGWWQRSARPGSPKGQTVLTGHTVHTGGGVMDELGRLRRGQLVKVVTPKGTMEYRTTRVVTWSKDELAKRAVDIFAQERPDVRLVLITCSGWTGSYYKSNVVVFAKPLGVRERKA
ncbi:MAG: Sortase family protein [Marmoricola sp.]|nr:Sortase family protein [Marmoricola sp.]